MQNVDVPTRARGKDEPYLLDLVITNDSIIERLEYLAPLGKSDHSLLKIKCKCKLEVKPHKPRLNYEKGNYIAFRNYLNVDRVEIFKSHNGDLDKMWNLFKDFLIKGTIKYLINIKQKWKRPMNKDIRSDIKNKSKLWKKYLKSKNKSILEEYKQISNSIRKQTRNINKEEQLENKQET
jgi:hypothetical protein